jgi:hypothetical protein
MRGPLIIHDPENPYADFFDEELVLTLSDWYHEQMQPLIKKFLSVTNPTGAEPGMFATTSSDSLRDANRRDSASSRPHERHTEPADPRSAGKDILYPHSQHGRLRRPVFLDRGAHVPHHRDGRNLPRTNRSEHDLHHCCAAVRHSPHGEEQYRRELRHRGIHGSRSL